ncbi:MAG TPA: hypothetical protein VLR49_12110 [Ferruginibacter sp.]|nr:hypothetical protein [Ferruginibacter sp.]
MKRIILFAPTFLFTCIAVAQQTEDDVYVGKARTFGNYRGTGGYSKLPKGHAVIIGTIVEVSWCEDDCRTILLKKTDGTMITVGTADFGFKIPKGIKGKKIIIEGLEPGKPAIGKQKPGSKPQQNIQFAASGLKLLD